MFESLLRQNDHIRKKKITNGTLLNVWVLLSDLN